MNDTPIYIITKTTPWPEMVDSIDWVDCDFNAELETYDEIASGVKMKLPAHVTRYRRTKRSFDSRNAGPEFEFIATVTFSDDSVPEVHGTMNFGTGMGSFDDVSS